MRVSGTIVVSNRGPLTFRAGPDGALVPVPAGGGLASSLHRLLAGSGTTWASVTMGAADREAVAQGLMHEDGLDLLPVVIDDETYRQAYDVVANTTLWYCHHHLFDLPHRPRFDRHWREAWEGYRAYNRAMADVVVARAGQGDAVFVQDYHFSLLGRMLAEARPDLRTVHFLHTPFAAPDMLAVLPDDVRAELLDGMAGYSACGFHCHQWEAGFAACYAAAGDAAAAPPTFVAPLGPDAGRARGGGGVARLRGGGGGVAGRGGRAPHHRPDRPHGAFEEHRAGDARLRGTADRVPRVARPGGARCVCVSQPAGAGRVSRLRRRRGAHGRAHQPRLRSRGPGWRWTPIVLSRQGRLGPLARRVDAVRRAAGQPGARRPQPRGQGGPAAQRGRRRARAVPPGRSLGGAGARRWRRARASIPSTWRARPTRCTPPSPWTRRRGRRGPTALRTAVRGRTSADWWADQLAAAQR